MSQLLIEDLVDALQIRPEKLDRTLLRKFCILIDLAIMANAGQQLNSLRKENCILSAQDHHFLKSSLVEGINAGMFLALNEPIVKVSIYDIFDEILTCLKFDERTSIKLEAELILLGFKEYDEIILQKGLVYTNLYEYGTREFSAEDQNVLNEASVKLHKQYGQLNLERSEIFRFNEMKKCVEMIEVAYLSDVSVENQACDLLKFYLNSLIVMNQLKKDNDYEVSEDNIMQILSHVKYLVSNNKMDHLYINDLYEVKFLFETLLGKDKVVSPIQKNVAKILTLFITKIPMLREWKALSDFSENERIDRVILMGSDDWFDLDLIATLKITLNNHLNENVVVTFEDTDVKRINDNITKYHHKPITLQVIGHGVYDPATGYINSNLAQYRGNAEETGKEVADLVNECTNISHVRLTSCHSGRLHSKAKLNFMTEKKRGLEVPNKELRRSLTLIHPSNFIDNQDDNPFVSNSAAVSCWNNIQNKMDREIVMTVSPAFIGQNDDDQRSSHLMWVSPQLNSSEKNIDNSYGIKEIQVRAKSICKF